MKTNAGHLFIKIPLRKMPLWISPIYRHGSTGTALQARLYRNGSAGTSLHRHGSTGTALQACAGQQAQIGRRNQINPISTRRLCGEYAGVGVYGAGPEARQVDLARLHRHGFTGTVLQSRLYRHSSTGMAL